MKVLKRCPLMASACLALVGMLTAASDGLAQPTYKLEVKSNLKPLAKLGV